MRFRIIVGWSVILMLSFSPIFLWFFFGPGVSELNDYSSITNSLGELLGLVGTVMLALTFVLSTRISFIEDVFGGLDKVYITHGIVGGLSLIFLLFHPIFLVLKFIPKEIDTAAKYLLPSSSWAVNFGIIALLGIILLVFLTLFSRMRYHRWKFTHEFFGLMFLFAVLHIFLVRGNASKDFIFQGYYIYVIIVSIIGFGGFSYSLFIKNRLFKNAIYSISSIENNKSFFKIVLTPEHKPLEYKSGQFVFIRFYNEKLSKEAHPFSIASKSNSREIIIIVKKLGDFTNRLEHLNIGDKVSIEGPYGRFNYKKFIDKEQIWIAGGIGITPFLGMVQDLETEFNLKKNIDMYYSVKEYGDFIGLNLLKGADFKIKKFRFIPWNSEKKGYLTLKDIYDVSGKLKNKEFFLCGPPKFKNSIVKSLLNLGVSKNKIHEEIFDFR